MKYRKKPIIVEAEQFFVFNAKYEKEQEELNKRLGVKYDYGSSTLFSIDTLEGKHEVSNNDWIVIGVKGEKYPVKPDIFEMTY